MAHYRMVGNVPAKRHVQHRRESGELYYEELMGEEGFFSDSSLLYHRYIPSTVDEVREWDLGDLTLTPNQPLLAKHLQPHKLFDDDAIAAADPVTGRRLLMGNNDVRLAYVVAARTSPWYRNATGDELLYLERGSARVETVFGALEVGRGDYVMIPRATTHRWIPAASAEEPLRIIAVECNSHVSPPRRYLSKYGQFLEHSPYCERDLRLPVAPLLAEDIGASPDEVTDGFIKHRGRGPSGRAGTVQTQPFNPLDVVGWDGCLYPYAFNISDYEPLTGRIHQPPPTHQVFEANNLVVCNFVPRKVDYHPLSIPVPYYHSNVDSDEVMFYVDGDYEARKGSGIVKGSISLHPGGHAHGPQPGAIERSLGLEAF
ncbi:MAG: homogentisate 1,2-dioxygenase domain-containing protein, partial [Pseudonocardia sp.]